jgi:hypothetical protein
MGFLLSQLFSFVFDFQIYLLGLFKSLYVFYPDLGFFGPPTAGKFPDQPIKKPQGL